MPENEKPRKKIISTPYNLRETFGWLVRNGFGPSKRNPGQVQFVAHHTEVNLIEKQFRVGFIGDIMDMHGKELDIAPNLKDFFQDCDFLIGNFEATLTDRPRHQFDQKHDPKIISALKNLFPANKTILSIANNHTGDFGFKICNDSREQLSREGFSTLGFNDTSRINIHPNLAITTGTMWSNRFCDYVANLPSTDAKISPTNSCEILYPHWGYEMELYPRQNIIDLAKRFFQTYCCIVGHHSHVPQPIAMIPGHINNIVAYSLGDFCSGLGLKNYSYGEALKCNFGLTSSGNWAIGTLDWAFTRCIKTTRTAFQVALVDSCPLHLNN